jgi:RNA polymerase sigma-70 factor (ECF subfamily)
MAAKESSLRWDRRMQQRLTRGEEAALGELYDRFASTVHSLAQRVTDDDDAADQVTREVFSHVWEHPGEFDPAGSSMRSWIASLVSERAVRRLREKGEASEERIRMATTAARADFIVTSMPSSLRAALDLAYYRRRSYRQTAEDLNVTEDEARRRLRLGLQLLSSANGPTESAL